MTTGELRRLPFVLHPLPDEPFGSWFEMMAATLRTPSGELARALGLLQDSRGPLGNTSWSVRLSDQQMENLERTTGLTRGALQATTREGFASNGIQYDRGGAISPFSPVTGNSGRYCPECLCDSGGRWRMTWQFSFGFACVRHQCLLVDTCPSCRKPPHRTTLPHRHVPTPGTCRNPIGRFANGTVERCGADLRGAVAEPVDVADQVLDAQRLIMRALSRPRTAEAMWAGGAQPAARVLSDLHLLARYARRSTRAREDHGKAASAERDDAPGLASAYAVAARAVHDPPLLEKLLGENVTHNTTYSGLSPQLQSAIAAARGMKRRATFVLQTGFDGSDPAKRAAKIPALLWADWTDHLAPRRIDRPAAALALSAAIVLAGSRLTHAAALRLLDGAAPSRRVTNVMRSLGARSAESDTLPAILLLAEYLDQTDTPVDYARRRELDYSDLVQPDEWEVIAIAENVHSGLPRRAILARAYVHRLLSGDRVQRLASRDGGPELASNSEVDGFAREAPVRVRLALESAGAAYLARVGIDEPVSWCPNPRVLGMESFEDRGTSDDGVWSARRPVRGAHGGERATAIAAANDEGLSIRATALKFGISRQTVARTREARGISARVGRRPQFHLDVEWLRQAYQIERRSAASMAREVGCSPTTILRQLRAAGVARGAV